MPSRAISCQQLYLVVTINNTFLSLPFKVFLRQPICCQPEQWVAGQIKTWLSFVTSQTNLCPSKSRFDWICFQSKQFVAKQNLIGFHCQPKRVPGHQKPILCLTRQVKSTDTNTRRTNSILYTYNTRNATTKSNQPTNLGLHQFHQIITMLKLKLRLEIRIFKLKLKGKQILTQLRPPPALPNNDAKAKTKNQN